MKQRLLDGEVLLGMQLRLGTPAIAELFSHAGFDYIVIDCEHAPQTPVGVQAQLQAIDSAGRGTTSIVRLGRNDPDEIRLYLDMGAKGIVVPFISTAEQARIGAEACRYPPKGIRGFGPARAAAYGFNTEYFSQFNDEVLFMPIIETAEAVENIDEILAVEGLDSFVIGPVDLSISMGVPMELDHPKMQNAVRRIADAARNAGKPAGTSLYGDLSDRKTFQGFIDMGYTLLLGGGDEWMLNAACKQAIEMVDKVRK